MQYEFFSISLQSRFARTAMDNKHRNNNIEIDNEKFRFNVDVYIFEEGDHLTAYCPSLDLATTGTDFQDALKNFYECLQLHVECCMEMGTFEEDLKEHGWRVSQKKISCSSCRSWSTQNAH